MSFLFAKQRNWTVLGFLWAVTAFMTAWLTAARINLGGFGLLEAAAALTSLLAAVVSFYFLRLHRVELFRTEEKGIYIHEGPARKKRLVPWGELSYTVWAEEGCILVKTGGSQEVLQTDMLREEDISLFYEQIGEKRPVYKRIS
ncbi:hypothetical protein [Alkalicoccus luteus]|uniref:Uncharacterized protein n=1 Tax=Alkalicoccus luteus TaxID=1237094 RepID=A0A969TUY9_9BACI|nr:hypothetical protein [Alkalicoccus luteus]NJP37840.1 hypothetical protein [Alkalicoccus luteus]